MKKTDIEKTGVSITGVWHDTLNRTADEILEEFLSDAAGYADSIEDRVRCKTVSLHRITVTVEKIK